MPITERTLRKWRKEALRARQREITRLYEGTADALAKAYNESQERILRMTQVLLDQHLVRKETR